MILFRAPRGFLNPTLFVVATIMPGILTAGEALAERGLIISFHHAHKLVLILAIFVVQVRGTCKRQVVSRVILPMVEPGDLLD